MRLLSPTEVNLLNPYSQRVYREVLDCIRQDVAADPFTVSSGFTVERDFSGGPGVDYLVRFEFRFREPGSLDISGNFGEGPRGIYVSAQGPGLESSLICDPDKCDDVCIQETRGLFRDWLTGELVVISYYANNWWYRRQLARGGQVLAARQRLIYPYWGKKRVVISRCSFGSASKDGT